MIWRFRFLNSVLGCALLWGTVAGQELPFLSEADYDWLVSEISGDAAYEHIRYFTQHHRPGGGAPGLMEVARYVDRRARDFGLADVRLIRQRSNAVPWSNQSGELWLVQPRLRKIASTLWHPLYLSDYSRSTEVDEAPLVDVGQGVREEDYEGMDVRGAVVLAWGRPGRVMDQAVWKRGALGIVTYPDPSRPGYPENSLNRPDSLRWSRIPVENREGETGTFGFRLSVRQGLELAKLVQDQGPATVRVSIGSSFGEERWQVMVEAFIRGREIDNQDVVLTAHLQEEKFSANDDASGCASVLEIARALNRLIDGGRLQRPRRNLRFWWVTEISSQRQYFSDHPDAHQSMMVNINQDMVGANQSQDLMRVQNMTRVPFSRFHFLNDVAERVLEFVVESNQANLAVLQAGMLQPYPKPILASLGSRQRYNARAIPFHNNTDHMTFNEAPIGVPGITFTNWPDNYIHSSDDDLWNIDRTQLQRNAFTVAAIAYVMADAGPQSFPAIAAELGGRGLERLSEDYGLALEWVAQSRDLFQQGLHQIDQGVKRELRAIESLGTISSGGEANEGILMLKQQIENSGKELTKYLLQHYRARYGFDEDSEELTETEQKLKECIPRITAGPTEFLVRRSAITPVTGLHGLMSFETLAFVDGRRSGLEIFRAVAAEARRAGSHYYGIVRPEDVLEYLEKAKQAEVLIF